MSYKLGLILSIAFMMAVLLLAGDLLNIAIIKNSLDALSLTVSYRIASEGTLSPVTREFVYAYKARIILVNGTIGGAFRIGDTVVYYLEKDYTPFVLGKETRKVSVLRSAVVGYYKN